MLVLVTRKLLQTKGPCQSVLKFLLTILNLGAEQFLVKHVQAKLYERGVAMSEALSNELPQIVKVPLSLVQTGFGLRGVKLAVKQCAHLFSLYSATHRATKGGSAPKIRLGYL